MFYSVIIILRVITTFFKNIVSSFQEELDGFRAVVLCRYLAFISGKLPFSAIIIAKKMPLRNIDLYLTIEKKKMFRVLGKKKKL